MKHKKEYKRHSELEKLISSVKSLIEDSDYDTCIELVCSCMSEYPHAPEPHNLLGIILEKTGDHVKAMKHFLAAWALDPTYRPANHNLNTLGTFASQGYLAYEEADILKDETNNNLETIYDKSGIGRVSSKSNMSVIYDKNGIGRVVRK